MVQWWTSGFFGAMGHNRATVLCLGLWQCNTDTWMAPAHPVAKRPFGSNGTVNWHHVGGDVFELDAFQQVLPSHTAERSMETSNDWYIRALTLTQKNGGRIFQSLVLIASICLSMFNHLWSNRFFRSWLRVSVVPATLWASKNSTRVSNCDRLSHFRLKSSNCCSSILHRGRCGSWMFYLRFTLHRSIIFTLSLGRSFTERVIWRWDVCVSQGDWLDSGFQFHFCWTFDGLKFGLSSRTLSAPFAAAGGVLWEETARNGPLIQV